MFHFFWLWQKSRREKTSIERFQENLITDKELFLDKQEVICDDKLPCPSTVAKVVIIENGLAKFCTGFLTAPDIIATSSSCLTNLLRLNGQDCRGDVFFFFPRSFSRKAERVGCKKVLQASSIETRDPELKNPSLWRSDISFLQTDATVFNRRSPVFSRDGMPDKKEMLVWSVDQVDDYSALLTRKSCKVLHGSYVNPLAANESSPNMLFSGCPFQNSNTGAPVIDSMGKVRGLVSQDSDAKIHEEFLKKEKLLNQPLRNMFHVTNMACAPTIYDTDVLDYEECSKDMELTALETARSEIISTTNLFSILKTKFEAHLESKIPYVIFGVKMVENGNARETTSYPKCFKKISDWIQQLGRNRGPWYTFEVDLPRKSFGVMVDEFAKIQTYESNLPSEHYYLEMNINNLRTVKTTTLFMWNDTVNLNFPNFTEKCSSLL